MIAPRKLFPSSRPLFGGWTSFGHPSITEILVTAGVDFIGIDLEHSTISQEQAQRIIAAAHAGGAACLPRIPTHEEEPIKRLLDSGADGIIAPNVSTPEEIERLLAWCAYPPRGRRSYGVARAQGYGTRFEEYVTTWNARSTLIIQIESIQAVERIETLLAVDEVDGVMIGPYDISGSLDIPGQLDHPLVIEACARIREACAKFQKPCGTQLVEPTHERVTAALEQGYRFIVLASDVFILWKWAERMRGMIQPHRLSPPRRTVARSRR